MSTDDQKNAMHCKARSKATGQRCKRPPIPGGTVCRYHGGNAPQVKRKAQERLAALVEPAITRLRELLAQKEDGKVALGAAKDILDRNGLKPKERVEHSGPDGGPMVTGLRIEVLQTRDADGPR